MLLDEAYVAFRSQMGKKIPINEHRKNKGAFGHSAEKFKGMPLGSHHLDFEDGELKTGQITRRNQLKEDFRVCSVWDKQYQIDKMKNTLVVLRDMDNVIVYVEKMDLIANPVYYKYYHSEYDKIMDIGLDNVSQSDTCVWVAKTQSQGGDAPKKRSLYMARSFASRLFGFSYPRVKGKHIHNELDEYESKL